MRCTVQKSRVPYCDRQMEKYKVLQRLGQGAQGSVFLAEGKLTPGHKCVLKKVECSDEMEARKVFKEVVALQKLKHPYICDYREFFVMWDKEECAIFVCMVMDYYPLGDLDHALKQCRAKNEFLEDLILKKWIGQMIEALHYVHQEQMIHRDLKPSNIFLRDNCSIAVGDFGVATVMKHMTRTAVGSMNWMAPEILDASSNYDERVDVWSLGCILLEMATCGFMDCTQISGMLFRLKDSPQVLEEVLDTVGKHYSGDLCQLIQTMLRRAFHQRPTTSELTDLPFVQECLALSNSPLYKGSKVTESQEVKPVPREGGLSAVVAYMKENNQSAACQVQALYCLRQLTQSHEHMMSNAGKQQVLWTMSHFRSSQEVQSLCCLVLGNVAITASQGDILFTKEFIQPICMTMRSHAGSMELQNSASALIMTLSSDEGAAEILGQVGGIQDLLAALRSFPACSKIASHCITALWNLSVIESNMLIITEEKGVQDVCRVLQAHISCRELVDTACSALWSLSMEDGNLNIMTDLGIVELLLQALEKHFQDPGVAKFACATLSSLAESHEVSAFSVLHTESGLEGIPIILKALNTHSDNGEVVESMATLFQVLANYEEIREELVSLKVGNTLAKINNKFAENEAENEAGALVDRALAVIEGKDKST